MPAQYLARDRVASLVIPFCVWTSAKRRRNIGLMFATAVALNIGEWIDHYLEVVNPQDP